MWNNGQIQNLDNPSIDSVEDSLEKGRLKSGSPTNNSEMQSLNWHRNCEDVEHYLEGLFYNLFSLWL